MHNARITTPRETRGVHTEPTFVHVLLRRLLRRKLRRRIALTSAFRPLEFHRIDARLDWVERIECMRMTVDLSVYLSDRPGHIEASWDHLNRLVMQLSDGRFLTLAGVTPFLPTVLRECLMTDEWYPSRLERDCGGYRLQLRDTAGREIHVPARLVSLTD
jgi:Arc/MetJ family transcription regulator